MKKGRAKVTVSIFLSIPGCSYFSAYLCVLAPIILLGILLDVLPVTETRRFVVIKTTFFSLYRDKYAKLPVWFLGNGKDM